MTQVKGLRRFWPQKVRTRLTVIYTGLFLSGGIVLLGLLRSEAHAPLPSAACDDSVKRQPRHPVGVLD